jgi:hypothetical protein
MYGTLATINRRIARAVSMQPEDPPDRLKKRAIAQIPGLYLFFARSYPSLGYLIATPALLARFPSTT